MTRTKFRVRATTALIATTVALSTAIPAIAATGAKPAPPPSSGAGLDGAIDGIVDVTQQRVRVWAGGKQQFGYNNEIIYWSVTGVRQNQGTESADLKLYSDKQNKQLVATSNAGGNLIDFIAVDSNHAEAPKTWYPTITSKGNGTYDIQNDTNEGLLTCSLTVTVPMTDLDLIYVIDSYVPANMEATITLTGGGDAQVFVMESKSGQDQTWYQSRQESLVNSEGAEGPETVRFTGTRDYYGVVVTQRSGAGPYQLNQECQPVTSLE